MLPKNTLLQAVKWLAALISALPLPELPIAHSSRSTNHRKHSMNDVGPSEGCEAALQTVNAANTLQ